MKPLEVWTCQRAENLKKKSLKSPKNKYTATMVSAAHRQIIGGGSAPINKRRQHADQQKEAVATNFLRGRLGRRSALFITGISPCILCRLLCLMSVSVKTPRSL